MLIPINKTVFVSIAPCAIKVQSNIFALWRIKLLLNGNNIIVSTKIDFILASHMAGWALLLYSNRHSVNYYPSGNNINVLDKLSWVHNKTRQCTRSRYSQAHTLRHYITHVECQMESLHHNRTCTHTYKCYGEIIANCRLLLYIYIFHIL